MLYNVQAGMLYWQHPDNIKWPQNPGEIRLYKSTLDNLWYLKDYQGNDTLINITDFIEGMQGSTSDGAQHEIFIGGNPGQRLEIENNTSSFIQVFVLARETNDVPPGDFGTTGGAVIQLLAKNVNGVLTVMSPIGEQNLNFGDAASFAWTVEIQSSGIELVFLVRGEIGKNINWTINPIDIVKVQG